MNERIAYHLGRALVRVVFSDCQDRPRVVVGYDARLSSPSLTHALTEGLACEGALVQLLGQCGSEIVYFAAGREDVEPAVAGGVMVTASHNPKDENGFKIVKQGARTLSGEELDAVASATQRLLDESRPASLDLADDYARRVRKVAGIRRTWNQQLRVVVEAGNGMGGVVFEDLARQLPFLDVVYSRCDPDGHFPDCLPNPLDPAYMALLAQRVLDERADIGLAFDGDADRVGVVDDRGVDLTPSEVMAVLVERFCRAASAEGLSAIEIMVNLTASQLVADRVEQLSDATLATTSLITPVGHGQIKPSLREHAGADYMARTGRRCVFAGEHSGHYFFPDFFRADSGMIAGLIMLEEVMAMKEGARATASLHNMVATWRETYFSTPETNFDMRRAKADTGTIEMEALKLDATERIREYARGLPHGRAVTHYDVSPGTDRSIDPSILKYEFTERSDSGHPRYTWWFCVRPSGNEPLLRLNLEIVRQDIDVDGPAALQEKLDTLIDRIGREYLLTSQ